MQIVVLTEKEKYTIRLSKNISGRYPLYDHQKKVAVIVAYKNKWKLQVTNDFLIDQQATEIYLLKKTVHTITNSSGLRILLFIEQEALPCAYQKFSIKGDLTIGRQESCAITYRNPYISSCHAVLHDEDGFYQLEDHNSTNHVYVNEKRFSHGLLHMGDVIEIMNLRIIVGNGFLAINQGNQEITCHKEYLQPYEVHESIQQHSYFLPSTSFRHQLQYVPPTISIKALEEPQENNELPFLLKLGPSFMMGIVSLSNIMLVFQNQSEKTTLKTYLPTLIMSFSMLVSAVFLPIGIHFYTKRKRKKIQQQKQQKYEKYLQDIQIEIEKEKKKETEILRYQYPGIQELWDTKTIWYLTPSDSPFLKVVIGIGSSLSSLHLQNESTTEFSMELKEVPLIIDMKEHYLIGVKGTQEHTVSIFYQLLLQLAMVHSWKDVHIVYIGNEREAQIRWLPHTEHFGYRCFFCEDKELSEFLELLKENTQRNKIVQPALVIFLCLDIDGIHDDCFDFIYRNPYQGITLITFSNEIKNYHMIRIDADQHLLQYKQGGSLYSFTTASDINHGDILRYLANCKQQKQQTLGFPQTISLLSMFSIHYVEELNIWNHWEKHRSHQTLQVPIGIQENQNLLYLDLHEKVHGPHGIIAGMTGSGKSECLLTFLISLAIHYHPQDVSFILIDYKGGGLAKLLECLPHTAGIVTNLEKQILQRTFEAFHSEIRKRQEILKDVSLRYQIANITINDYQRLYFEHKVKLPLSHLFIVCDEFAELKTQEPLYMDQLISIARIGRSLGIHLILATQKPSGIINDQIWSNTNFHLCLKVAQKADSMDMLKKPDAAFLKSSGQFFLQIGNEDRLLHGLSAWTQAPYLPQEQYPYDSAIAITNTGKKECEVSLSDIRPPSSIPQTQLEVVLHYLCESAEKKKIHAKPLWLPPLTKAKPLTKLEKCYDKQNGKVLMGEVDDPFQQAYRGLYMSLQEHVVVYANKDQHLFLKTFIYSCIHSYTSDEIHIYMLDLTEDFPLLYQDCQVFERPIAAQEAEKVHHLFSMLIKELEERKRQPKNQILFVILHGFALFSERCSIHQEDLRKLLREGSKQGIQFLCTVGHENEIGYHYQPYFSQLYVLDLENEEEYTAILHQKGYSSFKYDQGRGFMKEEKTYEFRLALPE